MKLNILILACLLMVSVQSCTVAVEKTLFENNYTGVTFDTPSEEITWSDPQTIEDYSQFTFQTLFNFNMFSPKFYDLNLVSEPLKSGLIATIKNGNKIAARIQYIAKSSDEEKDFLLFQFYAYNQSDNPIQTKRFYSNLIQPYKDTLMIVSYSNDQDLANGKFSVFLKGHDDEGAVAYDQAIWEVKQVNFSDSLNIRIGREIVQDGIMGFNGYLQDTTFKLNACVRTLEAAETMFTEFPVKQVQPLYINKLSQHYKRDFAKNTALIKTIQNLQTSNEFSFELHYKQTGEFSDDYQNVAQITMHDEFFDIDNNTVIGNDFMSIQVKKDFFRFKILADYDFHKGGFQNFNVVEVSIPVLDANAWSYIRISIDNTLKKGKVDVKFPSTSKTHIFEITNAHPNALKFQFGNYGESDHGVIGEFGQIQFSNGEGAYKVQPLDELSSFEKEHICYDEYLKLKEQKTLRAYCEYSVTEDTQKNIMTAQLFINTLQLKCFTLSFYYEDLVTEDKTFYELQESVNEGGGYKFLVNINDDSTIKFSYIGETDQFYTKQAILKLVLRQAGDDSINKLTIPFVYIKEVSRIDEKIVNNQYMEPECQNPGETDCKVTVYPNTVIRELDEQGNEISASEQPTETKIIKDQEISYVIKLVSFNEAYQVTLIKSVFEVKNEDGNYEVIAEDFVTTTIVPDAVDISSIDNGWIKLFYTPTTDEHYNKDARFIFTTQLVKLPGSRRNLMGINRDLQTGDLPVYTVTQNVQIIDLPTATHVNCNNPTATGMEYCRQCFKYDNIQCKTCKSSTRNPENNCLCNEGYTDVTKQGQVTECFESGTTTNPPNNLYYLFILLVVPVIFGVVIFAVYKKLKNKGVPTTKSNEQKYQEGEQESAKSITNLD